jgi:hypothetical protein
MVIRELLVFGRNHGDGKYPRDLLPGDPLVVNRLFMSQSILENK